MKFCKDCKHFYGWGYCRAPINGISPVDGEPNFVLAVESRKSKSAPLHSATLSDFGCGPDGTFFEEKVFGEKVIVEPNRPWYKFWS